MFFKRKRGMDFVDRGDPAAADFNKDTLTLDGNWNELDLSGIIPKAARLVKIVVVSQTSAGYIVGRIRKNGNTNEINLEATRHITLNVPYYKTFWVACEADGLVEYDFSAGTYAFCDLTVSGWFE